MAKPPHLRIVGGRSDERSEPAALPVVAIGTASYVHRLHGRIQTPTLEIVDWW